jgi:hypothetical protein
MNFHLSDKESKGEKEGLGGDAVDGHEIHFHRQQKLPSIPRDQIPRSVVVISMDWEGCMYVYEAELLYQGKYQPSRPISKSKTEM